MFVLHVTYFLEGGWQHVGRCDSVFIAEFLGLRGVCFGSCVGLFKPIRYFSQACVSNRLLAFEVSPILLGGKGLAVRRIDDGA